jgi:hypothetical protein
MGGGLLVILIAVFFYCLFGNKKGSNAAPSLGKRKRLAVKAVLRKRMTVLEASSHFGVSETTIRKGIRYHKILW